HGLVGSQLPAAYDALLREVAAGRPVLVLQNLGIFPFDNWHYAVVVGFDYEKGELYLRSGATKREALPFTIFEVTWKRSGYWAMVVTPPDTIPATATEATYLPTLVAFERGATPAQSRTAWEAFQARWPGNSLASVALSNRYYADKDLPRASAVLRLAAQKNPGSAEVLNNLAQMLSDMDQDEEALEFIERAAAIKGPFEAEVAATRAGIIRKLGGIDLKLTDYSSFARSAGKRPTSGQP
ncbi:MAG: PA2778 family cysteine peptidase, partial [Bdellovibrionales bacterium]|nr:PA2778 family cysteine peptidase [Ramlibacter sp.]